jgi:hypothetical protein
MGMGGKAPTTNPPGAAYTPVQQGPVYQPQYQQYQPQYQQYQPQQRTAQPQQYQQQQQMPNYQSGLQAAMMHMMQQYNRPMMRPPLQQGISPSSPMMYKPNMTEVNRNLTRVAPSVEVQQRLAAEEAARQAAIDAANAPRGGE